MPEPLLDDREFTDEELRAAVVRVGEEARAIAFAAGRPVYFMKGRAIIAQHADGTEEIVELLGADTDATVTHN